MSQPPLSDQSSTTETSVTMIPTLVLGLCAFLVNFDVTAVIIALPGIARELALDVAGYAWVMNAYSLAFTGSLIVAGALADRHGRRRIMLWGNIIFAIASLACGFAWEGLSLTVARGVQGVGSALLITSGIALIATTYPAGLPRTRAFSWLGVSSGVAMAFGPTIGGVVASTFGWRWIFLVNVPICALIAWWVPRLVGESREASPRSLDWLGMALLTAALFTFIEALLHGKHSFLHQLIGLLLSALLLASFVFQQGRRDAPVLDPSVFLSRPMIGIAILLSAVSIGYWAVLVFLPLFFGAAYGWTLEQAGFALLAATLPMLVLPPLGGRLVERLGWRIYFTAALAFITFGNVALVVALLFGNGPIPLWQVMASMAAMGIGASLAHPQLSSAVVALAPAEQVGMASAITIVARQGAFAIGVAVLGATNYAPDRWSSYVVLFSISSLAGLLGMVAAKLCLPSFTVEQKS